MVTIIVVGIVMALFTGLLFVTKKQRTSKETLVGAFMAALVIPMIEKLILDGGFPIPYFGFSLLSGTALSFGPFLYFYTVLSISEEFRFSKTLICTKLIKKIMTKT